VSHFRALEWMGPVSGQDGTIVTSPEPFQANPATRMSDSLQDATNLGERRDGLPAAHLLDYV
jgi:hypothetical protein